MDQCAVECDPGYAVQAPLPSLWLSLFALHLVSDWVSAPAWLPYGLAIIVGSLALALMAARGRRSSFATKEELGFSGNKESDCPGTRGGTGVTADLSARILLRHDNADRFYRGHTPCLLGPRSPWARPGALPMLVIVSRKGRVPSA